MLIKETVQVIRLLLWQKRRVWVNTLKSSKLSHKIINVIVVLLALIGVGIEFLILTPLMSFAVNHNSETVSIPEDVQLEQLIQLVTNAPILISFAMTIVIVITGIAQAFSNLFFAEDMQQLLLAPIPTRAIFAGKLLIGINSSLLFLLYGFIIPLIAYGIALDAPIMFYVLVLLIAPLLPLLPLVLGASIAIGLLRIIPAHRTKELLGLFTSLFGISCYLLSQIFFNSKVIEATNFEQANLLVIDQAWLPTSWIGRGLIAVAQAAPVTGLGYLGLWLAVSIGVFFASIIGLEKIYHNGLLALRGTPEKRKKQRLPGIEAWQRWQGQTRALLQKERRVLLRDTRNILLIVWPLAFLGIWIWRTSQDNDLSKIDPTTTTLSLIGITFLISQSLSSRLALSSISREQHHYWILRIAPISYGRLYWSKWLFAWLVFPSFSIVLLAIGFVLGVQNPTHLLLGWLSIIGIGAGATAIATGFGVAYPKLDWDNPNQMVSGRAGCLGQLCTWIYVLISAGLLGVALAPFFYPTTASGFLPNWISILCSVGFIVITISAIWGASALGISHLKQFER